jgi:hypothetical protein
VLLCLRLTVPSEKLWNLLVSKYFTTAHTPPPPRHTAKRSIGRCLFCRTQVTITLNECVCSLSLVAAFELELLMEEVISIVDLAVCDERVFVVSASALLVYGVGESDRLRG